MALGALQERLGELYDVELDVRVEDFLCDEDTARALGGEDAAARGEVLFVIEGDGEGDGARVALFLEPRARELGARRADFHAWCLAAEGVSHFVYLAFRADHQLAVSELELELQAEVDKWALALLAPFRDVRAARLLAGRGVGAIALRDRSRRVRERLFGRARFLDDAETERGARYRAALRLAARYAETLERELVARGDVEQLARELRRFYRLGSREKIERIG